MNTSTLELFSNFKITLNDYTATAFSIGTFMSACKTALDNETKEQFKQNIRKTINEEIELEKSLDDYIVDFIDELNKEQYYELDAEFNMYNKIKNAIESLRKTSYDAGKAYYIYGEQEEYERLQSVFNEDHDALLNMMEKELEHV